MSQSIPYGRQDVGIEEIRAATETLESDWLTTGPAVTHFEAQLEEWTGGAPVAAVSSGTAALHCAYAAIDLKPGDEIITPPLTFVATQAAAVAFGAKPIFVDVCEDTGNIDPRLVEKSITSATKAIVAVDFAGHPADISELLRIARQAKIPLIEDAAHSLGSQYRGKFVGSLADITTFSFFPTKNITTGEGGAVASNRPELLQRAREFANQGLVRDPARFVYKDEGPWHQEVQRFGLNYRMPDILAAVGSAQLRKLESFTRKRALIKARYDEAFGEIPGVLTPRKRDYVNPVWHLYPIRVPGAHRRRVFQEMRSAGILVQVNYMPAYRHPAFVGIIEPQVSCTQAEDFYSREISLPIFPRMTNQEIDYVISNFIRVAKF